MVSHPGSVCAVAMRVSAHLPVRGAADETSVPALERDVSGVWPR
jgi:hypothetical protein